MEERTLLAIDALIHNFDGHGASGIWPPDTVGDVGPHHFIEMTNYPGGSAFSIFDKSGQLIQGPTSVRTLAESGTACATSGGFDPIVLYDSLADRWLLSEVSSVSSGRLLCVYISQTSDATGAYYPYQFDTPGVGDYPKYAVWPDAYYVGVLDTGVAMYALDRVNMLQGLEARPYVRCAESGLAFFPADFDGDILPPEGAPNLFLTNGGDLRELQVDFDDPIDCEDAVTSLDDIGYTIPLGGTSMTQPGPGTPPSIFGPSAQSRIQYRNYGDFESIVMSITSPDNGIGKSGVGWVEIRREGSEPWALYQEGLVSVAGSHRFLPTSAMDREGNAAKLSVTP